MRSAHSFDQSPFASTRATLQSTVQAVKGLKAFVTLLFDESGSLEPVWQLSNSLLDSAAFQLAVASMKATPAVAAIVAERYMGPPHDLEVLLQYPKHSLGHVYARHMRQLGLQPLEPVISASRHTISETTLKGPGSTSHTEICYVESRWQQTHDIWHIITGFDTSPIGEIGLQAFYLAQFRLPLSSLLIANALISVTLLQPEALDTMVGTIVQGWQMGKTASPLIAQKWEEAWEKPVTVWQKELNVHPVSA